MPNTSVEPKMKTPKGDGNPPGRETKQKNLTIEAYGKIKNMLYNQDLVPGQKIIYEDLAKRFNMSTTPIVNALSRLEQDGLVVSKYNRGYFVSEISEKEAEELLETRQVLEEYCINKIIDRYNQIELSPLETALNDSVTYTPGAYTRRRLYLDSIFHIKIAELSGNTLVKDIIAHIFEKMYLRYATERIPLQRMETANREHTLLFEAIKSRDKRKALKVLDDHYKEAKRCIMFTIKREHFEPEY